MKDPFGIKSIVLICVICLLNSCSNRMHDIEFVNCANDYASIHFKLNKNGQFNLDIIVGPEIGNPDSKEEKLSFNGNWKIIRDQIECIFSSPIRGIDNLFPNWTERKNLIHILNNKTISLPLDADNLIIFNVACEKSK